MLLILSINARISITQNAKYVFTGATRISAFNGRIQLPLWCLKRMPRDCPLRSINPDWGSASPFDWTWQPPLENRKPFPLGKCQILPDIACLYCHILGRSRQNSWRLLRAKTGWNRRPFSACYLVTKELLPWRQFPF